MPAPVPLRYAIEDEAHAETLGYFADLDAADLRLRELAGRPWDAEPNRPPCANWQTCGRRYEVVVYDTYHTPWAEISRKPALDVSADAIVWHTHA